MQLFFRRPVVIAAEVQPVATESETGETTVSETASEASADASEDTTAEG